MQWQVSVASADEMRAAKKEPENWRNLIVRIGGFSIYFNSLSPEMQDSVIARTEIVG
jgi:formate C-acetyltransferase